MDDLVFVLRLHLPKGNFPILSVVGIRNIEHIADTVWKVGAAQQGNTGGSPVYPAAQSVPHADFRTGGGIRALGVDQHLLLKAVFVILGGGPQESGVVAGIGCDLLGFG